MKLAEKIRDIRHLVQQRREAEIDWTPVALEIDALASAEAEELKQENT